MRRGKGRPFGQITRAWMEEAEGVDIHASPPPSPDNLTPLKVAARAVLEHHYKVTSRYGHARAAFASLCNLFPEASLETLTKDTLLAWVRRMRLRGNKASTINCNLTVVGVLFKHFDIEGRKVPYVRETKVPQWWLTPEMEKLAIAWCRTNDADAFADYIQWMVLTGLRAEETLRTQRQHFTGLDTDQPSLTVPGTKTRAAQATIPLLAEAADIARRRMGTAGAATDRLNAARLSGLKASMARP